MRTPWEMVALACVALIGMTAPDRASAQTAAHEDGESTAVRTAAREYLSALHRGDFAQLRSMWTPDGDYVDAVGNTMKAVDVFRAAKPPAETADAEAPAPPESTLRFVAPNVAVEDGATGIRVDDDGRRVTGRFTAVWVKQDGKWLLDCLRESTAAAPPGKSELRVLDWLIGEWAGSAGDADVLMSWHWSDGGSSLVGEFVIYRDGAPVAGGTQHIGWDPTAGKIKSWTFDSQGGAGEGHWRADGDRWLSESDHVTADGKKASTTAMYAPGDAGTFVLEVASKWVGDDGAEGVDRLPAQRIEFRRAAEDE